MSRRNARSNVAGVELKLNLSPQRDRGGVRGAGRQAAAEEASPETSPARSCLSEEDSLKYSSSPETSMVVVGCPRCLMYVMLSEVDPRCPKCKSTVLLDLHPTTHRLRHDEDDDDNGAAVN